MSCTYRKDFCDLAFLKKMIADPSRGWPNVIINTTTKQAYRPDVKGTLSIFSNVSGTSMCGVEGREVKVEDNMYFITNDEQNYTLTIDEQIPSETFNIHFSTHMLKSFAAYTSFNSEQLLDLKEHNTVSGFHNRLYNKDDQINNLLKDIYQKGNNGDLNNLLLEDLLGSLLSVLVSKQKEIKTKVLSIDVAKQTTRLEIYKRQAIASDYIHSYYDSDITLDDLARVSNMSKFHFLRTFKEINNCTPYQYMMVVRMKKAKALLLTKSSSIKDIGHEVGYDDASAFCRAFNKYYGYAPSNTISVPTEK